MGLQLQMGQRQGWAQGSGLPAEGGASEGLEGFPQGLFVHTQGNWGPQSQALPSQAASPILHAGKSIRGSL